jgi:hypothetical protein
MSPQVEQASLPTHARTSLSCYWGDELVPGPRPWVVGPARERTFVPDFGICQSPAHANTSSSAFASLRSGVSKPSVNQP